MVTRVVMSAHRQWNLPVRMLLGVATLGLSWSMQLNGVQASTMAFQNPSLGLTFSAFGPKKRTCGLRTPGHTVSYLRMQTTQDKVKVQEPEETLGERYLRESNQCRPVTKNFVRIFDNSEERPSVDDIGAGGTSVVSFKVGGKTVVATPEVALSAQCEKLVADLQRQSEDTATTVACFGDQRAFKDVQKTYPRCDCLPYIPPMTSKPLCSVVFCEDRPAPLPSRLLDSGFRSSPSFARLFLQLASSRLAQNLFPRMSWPIQRWVVSKVGRVEALLGMRRYDKAVASECPFSPKPLFLPYLSLQRISPSSCSSFS